MEFRLQGWKSQKYFKKYIYSLSLSRITDRRLTVSENLNKDDKIIILHFIMLDYYVIAHRLFLRQLGKIIIYFF